MSSTYIPPHKRNQNKTPATAKASVNVQLDEKDFAPLSSKDTKILPKVDWKSVNFDSTRKLELPPAAPVPLARPVRRQTEWLSQVNEYSQGSDDLHIDGLQHTDPVPDGWTLVEKKVRVKRDKVQEALDNGDAPLSDDEEEQSYWDDQPEEYETYWDRKPN